MANETLVEDLIEPLREAVFQSLEPLVTIFQIVGIALLFYIIFLIVKALFRWKTMSKIVKMAKNVNQINNKMDVLIEKIDKIGGTDRLSEIKKRKKGKK